MMQLEGAPSAEAAIVRRLAPSHAAGGRFGLILGMALMMAILTILQPAYFLTRQNLTNIARGATYLLSGGVPISGLPRAVRLWGAEDITLFGGTSFPIDFPISFLIVIALYLAVWVFLTKTRTGRHVYAIGGSPKAAQYAGINISRNLTLVYALSGGLAGVAGALLAGRLNSGYPTAGTGAELDAIAAVIIGGASFFGGRGTAGGVFIGAVIMGLLRNGVNLMNVSVFLQQVLLGFIILLAVYLDVLRRRAMRVES